MAPAAPGLTGPGGYTVAATGTLAALCEQALRTGTRLMTTQGAEVRCVGAGGAPLGMTGGTGFGVGQTVGGGVVARGALGPALGDLFPAPVVPASNPAYAPAVVSPPPGYRAAWDDGRLNPHRGLPPGTIITQAEGVPPGTVIIGSTAAPRVMHRALAPQVAAPVAPDVATPVAAPQAAPRYVQVGTYADPANAARAIAGLQGLGLPVGTMRAARNGQALQVVLAGPFGDTGAAQAALGAARGAGFGDAFIRD